MSDEYTVSPEQPEKRPRGRQKGWRKEVVMEDRIPAMRVPAGLYEWLGSEADERGLKIPDMARMLLLQVMKKAQKDRAEETKNGIEAQGSTVGAGVGSRSGTR